MTPKQPSYASPDMQPQRDHPAAYQTRRRLIERRRRVAELRLQGHSQREIAQTLGVDASTISRDFAALDQEYRDQAATTTRTQKGLDLDRIERAIGSIWDRVLAGDLKAIEKLVGLLARKAKALGLDEQPGATDWRESVRGAGLDPTPIVDVIVNEILRQRGQEPPRRLDKDEDEDEDGES